MVLRNLSAGTADRHHRQAQLIFHHAHHRERSFRRTGIGFDEQVLEQRIKLLVQLERERGIARGERPHHARDFVRNHIRRHADDTMRADRHERQRERIIAAEDGELMPERLHATG
jgi:hypothetical protein